MESDCKIIEVVPGWECKSEQSTEVQKVQKKVIMQEISRKERHKCQLEVCRRKVKLTVRSFVDKERKPKWRNKERKP
eukprot:294598-Amphidinium_carterae.1